MWLGAGRGIGHSSALGSGAFSGSKGVRMMAQAGSPMGIEALEMLLSGRTETRAVPRLSVSVVKGKEESLEASEILIETVRGNALRLPPWWKSKCRKTRKLVYVYADSSH
jgi:hypothetical protein